MAYIPRLTAPSPDDPNWIQAECGGRNRCIRRWGKSVLPNCTGYAWGRFMELLGGEPPKLSVGDAGMWYGHPDGYQRGTKPQLGAVICFSNPGHAGHVAIVEQIHEDGSIVVSESGYSSKRQFWTSTRYPPNYDNGTYILQGFIYNPACAGLQDKLTEFLSMAESRIGGTDAWTRRVAKCPGNNNWKTAFVNACALSVKGLSDVVIPNSNSASDMVSLGVEKGMGVWIDRIRHNRKASVFPGDILFTIENHKTWVDVGYSDKQPDADCVGIVTRAEGDTISTVQGDVRGIVARKDYSALDSSILGYYRPFWSKVGANVMNSLTTYGAGNLYEFLNTEEDASVREIGYLNHLGQPSIQANGPRLSVINYTSTLNAILGLLGVTSSPILDNLEAAPRICTEILMSKGLNCAAAIGIVANIEHESSFKTDSKGDYQNGVATSFGICGWHLGRGDAMKKFVGPSWPHNLSGQVEFLWNELITSYTHVLKPLQQVPNTELGARKAADIFVRKFEIPYAMETQSRLRQEAASKYWNQIAIQMMR